MDELIKEYLSFLAEQYGYLTKIKLFLNRIPQMIVKGEVNQLEFQGFLEKYEVQNAHFIYEKNRFQQRIGERMRVTPEQVTFKLLVHVGHRQFEDKGRRLLRITNEIKMQLVKISIYMKNFARMQEDFRRLSNFLYQNDYTPRGTAGGNPYLTNTGRNYYGEA
jgi:hypothetical protein